ncbi:hypothetical protein REPUB_Repub17cG0098400 [Reevesia pubescens]
MCKVDLEGIPAVTEHVDDPTRVKTKGKHVPKDQIKKKSRRCGHCRMEGHRKNKCPYLELTLSSFVSSNSMDDEIDLDSDDNDNVAGPSQIGRLFCDDSSEDDWK